MTVQHHSPITILGAGSWGTALALYLSRLGQDVRLWSFQTDHVESMRAERVNTRYLPLHAFPPTLQPHVELSEALLNVRDVLIAVPSVGFRDTLTQIKPFLTSSTRILSVTKGLDINTGLLHHAVHDILGTQNPYAVLSGPSFAREVAAGLPTAVVIASQDTVFANDLLHRFNSMIFRVYLSADLVGVEISGVVKNIIAIATGISDGMGFGTNARCALITRGLAEMTRLGLALDSQAETFTGLAGLGDLVLTCTDDQSRNRRFGIALGEGKKANEAERDIGQVVEGKQNAQFVIQLATQLHVEMPIATAVWHIFQENLTPLEAMKQLLTRETKHEGKE